MGDSTLPYVYTYLMYAVQKVRQSHGFKVSRVNEDTENPWVHEGEQSVGGMQEIRGRIVDLGWMLSRKKEEAPPLAKGTFADCVINTAEQSLAVAEIRLRKIDAHIEQRYSGDTVRLGDVLQQAGYMISVGIVCIAARPLTAHLFRQITMFRAEVWKGVCWEHR